MESKGSRTTKVASGLLFALAICCCVMYMTADGGLELDAALQEFPDAKGNIMPGPTSAESSDVAKAEHIFSETPDGNMRLFDYLQKVERLIAHEVAGRKRDLTKLRVHLAKNRAYNAEARGKMRKDLKKRMAENAAAARRHLATAMRQTQAQFASAAQKENARHKADIARFKKTRAMMRANKRAARYALRQATLNQQRALSTLASATNAHISQSNKHIAANAAQMAANAKQAQKDLQGAMNNFNNKMAKVRADAKAGRSKLMAQAANQDKKFRTWANNKVMKEMASVAANFRRLNKKLAKDRHHADMMLKTASTKMTAALNTQVALQDRRFKKTVSKLDQARKEADNRLAKAQRQFKVQLAGLASTAKKQVYQLKAAQSKLQGVVKSNKAAQAETNRNVNAELKRMVKLGNNRFKAHLKKDKELKALLAKNQAKNEKKMAVMANAFNARLGKIRKQMEKDRRHNSDALKKSTKALHATLARNIKAQEKVDAQLNRATAQLKRSAADALQDAKLKWASKLAGLHAVAVKTALKQEKKINKLAGIEEANALKSKQGRQQLRTLAKANKEDIDHAITKAINQGEQRAMGIEAQSKATNSKNRATLQGKIQTEISHLRAETKKALFKASLESKTARMRMRKQVLHAIQDAKDVAAKNLKDAVTKATARMAALEASFDSNQKSSAGKRKRLKAKIKRDKKAAMDSIQAAVDAQSKSMLAEQIETAAAMAETNKKLKQNAATMKRNAAKAAATMEANGVRIAAKLTNAISATTAQQKVAKDLSMARYVKALKAVRNGVKKAEAKAEVRFGKAYETMANDRAKRERQHAKAVADINDALAEQISLQSIRYDDNVKKIKRLRAQNKRRVARAQKAFKMSIATVTSEIKKSETRIQGDLDVVAGAIVSDKIAQQRTNMRVAKSLKSIENKSNRFQAVANRKNKEIKAKMNAAKKEAAAEVKALADRTKTQISLTRAKMAEYRRDAAISLTKATKKLSNALLADKEAQQEAMAGLKQNLNSERLQAGAALAKAKAVFKSKVTTMTNTITANQKAYERRMRHVTGVAYKFEKSSKADRALIRQEMKVMQNDLTRSVARAIQLGEARAKRTQEDALAATDNMRKSMVASIAESVDNMADKVFNTVQSNRNVVADNYLSLKAYAVASSDKLKDYVAKGKGRNLASIGDLLSSIADLKDLKVGVAEGLGAGGRKMAGLFSTKAIKIKSPVNRMNFIVDEYFKTLQQVQSRWQLGLGKYLLNKIDISMQKKGVLEVDKITNKAGSYVFISANAVGLASRFSDLMDLSVAVPRYQAALAKLSTVSAPKKKGANKGAISKTAKAPRLKPPEWKGN